MAADINVVTMTGRLTREPELKKTQSGQSVLTFNLAVDRMPAKDGTEAADFPSVTAWGKTAEIISQYCQKGSPLAVTGRLQTRNYEDRDGRKVYVTEVIANQVKLLEPRKRDTDSAPDPYFGSGSSVYQKDLTGDAISGGDDLPF